jgi:hypothetical protein
MESSHSSSPAPKSLPYYQGEFARIQEQSVTQDILRAFLGASRQFRIQRARYISVIGRAKHEVSCIQAGIGGVLSSIREGKLPLALVDHPIVHVDQAPWEFDPSWLDSEGQCWLGDASTSYTPSWRFCRPLDAPRCLWTLPHWAIRLPPPSPDPSTDPIG